MMMENVGEKSVDSGYENIRFLMMFNGNWVKKCSSSYNNRLECNVMVVPEKSNFCSAYMWIWRKVFETDTDLTQT